MNIGEAARATGISAKMIRHYETIGLIPPPGRTEAGYRVYDAADLHTLAFVRRARAVGFSMEQIRTLLDLWHDRDRASADVRRLATEQIALLEARKAELEGMIATLGRLVAACRGDERPDCPIIDEFAASRPPEDPQAAGVRRSTSA